MKLTSFLLVLISQLVLASSLRSNPTISWKKYEWASNSKGLITTSDVPKGAEVKVRVLAAGENDIFELSTIWGSSRTIVSHWKGTPSTGQVLKHKATTSDALYFTIGGGNYTEDPISIEKKDTSQLVRFKDGWTIEIKVVEEDF